MGVKSACVSAFLLFSAICHGQATAAKQTLAFQWNWRDTQSLTGMETVATSNDISANDRAMLLDSLLPYFKNSANPKERALQTRVRPVDLNSDGVPELICQASGLDLCSPTGNCAFWIFQKTLGGYRLLLSRGSVQNFTVQPTGTSGFADLVLGIHGSATEQGLSLYRFHEGRYRKVGCYEANWQYLGKDGEYHDSKEPKMTPCR
jgi:hypothetical protein